MLLPPSIVDKCEFYQSSKHKCCARPHPNINGLNKINYIYLWLRFGLANAIDDNLGLKICVVWMDFLLLIAYWVRFIFVYQKYLKRTFQTGYWLQNHRLNFWFRDVNSQRLFCSKKLVWNVRIKAFWYTKRFASSHTNVIQSNKNY